MLPSKCEAEELLIWAHDLNPGPWAEHSRVVARAAETIAKECKLDAHRAYVSGLLHDIGRYEGKSIMHHVYAGYELLKGKGYDQIADICLSHSFPYQDIDEYYGKNDCSPEETAVIKSYLSNTIYNDYDKLIQLCDTIGSAAGVCLMEVRMIDVIRRYGFSKLTTGKIEAVFSIKAYFDKLCDMDIYNLFHDEVRDVSFYR
jgi:putative nucleotidyltransferase with HDIG domain